jgi:hypothetical protein
MNGTSLRRHVAQSTHPQPCAEAPDVAEAIEPTFATPRNPAFQGEIPCTRDTSWKPWPCGCYSCAAWSSRPSCCSEPSLEDMTKETR